MTTINKNSMKNLFNILISILVINFPGHTQKLKDKKVEFHYVRLPKEKLPDDFKTFSVHVYGKTLEKSGHDAVSISQSVKMDGFKPILDTENNYGHLRIYLNTGDLAIDGGAFKSEMRTRKEKDGKEIHTNYYWYEFKTKLTCRYQVLSPDGKILSESPYGNVETKKSKEYTNSEQLRRDYESIKWDFVTNGSKDAVKSIASLAQRNISVKYDYKFIKEEEEIYYLKNHESEEGFELALDNASNVFSEMKANTSPSEIMDRLYSSVEFWKGYAEQDPPADKKLKVLYLAANYNLAVVSFYLDDFEKAVEYANRVIASEGKDRKSSKLIERVKEEMELMKAHEIYTLHYKREIENALAPAEVSQVELERELLVENSNSMNGKVLLNESEVSGIFVVEKDAEDLLFGLNGNVKFLPASGDQEEINLSEEKVRAFQIGDRNFIKTQFYPSAKGKSTSGDYILEKLYESGRITLYKYYPSSSGLNNEKPEFAFRKNDESIPVSMYDAQFLLWEKGLANYFRDCEDLSAMAQGGSIKMNQEDLVKAARIYSDLCN